jgi:hypothetical protein
MNPNDNTTPVLDGNGEFDMNIENWSVHDLTDLLDMNKEPLTTDFINKNLSPLITRFSRDKDQRMVNFFKQAREKLLNEEANYRWGNEEHLIQTNNPEQNNKRTDRRQRVKIFSNEHFPMKREALGVNQGYNLPIAQGELNPDLRNIYKRMVTIDSKFRPNNVYALKNLRTEQLSKPLSEGVWSPTSFTFDLSEPLSDLVELFIYSVQIPYTWYVIDEYLCNNKFEITYSTNQPTTFGTTIVVPSGNYNEFTLRDKLNDLINDWYITDGLVDISGFPPYISYSESTGKYTSKFPHILLDPSFEVETIEVRWFNECNRCGSCVDDERINHTLGWMMGYRDKNEVVTKNDVLAWNGFVGDAVADINGPRYFYIYLDDFNNNRLNKGAVHVLDDANNKLPLPSYYVPNITTSKINENTGSGIPVIHICPSYTTTECDPDGNESFKPVPVPFYTQNLPKTITQKQQYALNEIIKNRKNDPNLKVMPTNTNNIIGIIPIQTRQLRFGQLFTIANTFLFSNSRKYFGPVDVERMEVRLLDDKGHVVNLNGGEWNFTLVSNHLYQY